MFDFSAGEILFVMVIALVVFGPQRLPDIARRVGKWTGELRKAAREIRLGLESEVAELREVTDQMRKDLDETKAELEASRKAFELSAVGEDPVSWIGPEPERGPKPSDAARDLELIEQGEEPVQEGGAA